METFWVEMCKDFIMFQNFDNINGRPIRDIILVLIFLMKQLSHQSTVIYDEDYVYSSEN